MTSGFWWFGLAATIKNRGPRHGKLAIPEQAIGDVTGLHWMHPGVHNLPVRSVGAGALQSQSHVQWLAVKIALNLDFLIQNCALNKATEALGC